MSTATAAALATFLWDGSRPAGTAIISLAVIASCGALFVFRLVQAKQKDRKTDVMLHGVLKRFSERNGWGLIAIDGTDLGRRARDRKNGLRPDVRLYRAHKEALGLNVGDAVVFRAIPDVDAPAWQMAVDVSRPDEVKYLEQPRLPEESSEHCLKRMRVDLVKQADDASS